MQIFYSLPIYWFRKNIFFSAHNEILSLNGPFLTQAKGALKNLDLSYNKISEFPAGIFSNGSRLQIL